MAYTTINKHTDYFNTLLYSGTGSATTVSGVGFQPLSSDLLQVICCKDQVIWQLQLVTGIAYVHAEFL